MKFNKKSILATILALCSFASMMHAQPNFEFWNKHNDPVYYALADSTDEINTKTFKELRAGKWTEALTLDISKPTIIALKMGKMPTPGDRIDLYTIKPYKKIIIRVGLPAEKEKFKETLKSWLGRTSFEGDGYIFGPQTGPLLGFRAAKGLFPLDWSDAINERGLSLKGNLTKNDIIKGSMIYLPQ